MLFFKNTKSNAPDANPITLLKVIFGFDAEPLIKYRENGDIDYFYLKRDILENEEFERVVQEKENKVVEYLECQLSSPEAKDPIIHSTNPRFFLNYMYSTNFDIFNRMHYHFNPKLVHTDEHGLVFKKGLSDFHHDSALGYVEEIVDGVMNGTSLRLNNLVNKIQIESRYAFLVDKAAAQFVSIDIDKKVEDFRNFFKQETSVSVEDEVIDL